MIAGLRLPLVQKEFRALFPLWAASLAALATSVLLESRNPFGILAYVFGAIGLGAQSIGHEHTYRTLPLLLSQPVSRQRLYRTKAAVLVSMVLMLAGPAALILVDGFGRVRPPLVLLMLGAPVLTALLLAPWLTMICRSALAGAVFSFALPATMFTLTTWFYPRPALQPFVWFALVIVLCGISGVLGWRRFMRLEAIEGPITPIELPAWSRWRRPRPGRPVWVLFLKELHLQQLTFALAGVFAVSWLALSALPRQSPEASAVVFDVLTPLGLALLTVLTGAVASAEERHYGTLASQLLLPVAAWRQWMVKSAVVFGLASVFASVSLRPEIVFLANVLAAASLYVSSISRSGFRAVVASLLLLPIVMAGFARLMGPLVFLALVGVMLQGMIMVGLLVWFAFVNHRTAESGGTRVVRQLAILCGVFFVSRAILLAALAL